MAVSRTQIRDSLKTLVEGATTSISVYKSRFVDARKLTKFIAVYFAEGVVAIRNMSGGTITTATLVISYNQVAQFNDDASLDVVADQIEAAIATDHTLSGLISLIKLTGWEYPDADEGQFSSIALKYELTFYQ